MGNILVKLKRIASNKNTMTILCVIAGVFVLYIGYNFRVKSATNPVNIPYAKTTLSSRHTITIDDIGTMKVSGTVLNRAKGIIRNSGELIGKEVAYGDTIQENSFFFKGDVVDADTNKVAASPTHDLEDGESVKTIQVTIKSTYGNAMYPGNYIDLWYEANQSRDGLKVYGKLIKSIRILDVIDEQGKSVFETSSEDRVPKYLLFAVADDYMGLIEYATTVGKLIPVPHNKSYTANPAATEIASATLRNQIYLEVSTMSLLEGGSNSTSNSTSETEENKTNEENNAAEEEF